VVGDLADLRAELDRLAVSFGRAGARDYAALHDMGRGIVWLMGPPRSGLRWQGPLDDALELLRPLPDDAGLAEFWRALDGEL
jgi:hypothetical protein